MVSEDERICLHCLTKFTLPKPYEECNPAYRDYCVNCLEWVFNEEMKRIGGTKIGSGPDDEV